MRHFLIMTAHVKALKHTNISCIKTGDAKQETSVLTSFVTSAQLVTKFIP